MCKKVLQYNAVMNWVILVVRCCSDPALKDACLHIRRCVPILDLMAMRTQFGVMAFTEDELKEICRFLLGRPAAHLAGRPCFAPVTRVAAWRRTSTRVLSFPPPTLEGHLTDPHQTLQRVRW